MGSGAFGGAKEVADSSNNVRDLCQQCEDMAPEVRLDNVRRHIPGFDRMVPVVGGRQVPYVNLDNAATTPPFDTVIDA